MCKKCYKLLVLCIHRAQIGLTSPPTLHYHIILPSWLRQLPPAWRQHEQVSMSPKARSLNRDVVARLTNAARSVVKSETLILACYERCRTCPTGFAANSTSNYRRIAGHPSWRNWYLACSSPWIGCCFFSSCSHRWSGSSLHGENLLGSMGSRNHTCTPLFATYVWVIQICDWLDTLARRVVAVLPFAAASLPVRPRSARTTTSIGNFVSVTLFKVVVK